MAQWTTNWAQAHADMSMICKRLKDYTARLTVTSQLSGQQIRLHLSNQEGRNIAVLINASVQLNENAPVMLSFCGKQKLCIEPGEYAYSDAVDMKVSVGDSITVSLAFAGTVISGNILPEFVRCSAKGNYTQDTHMVAAKQSLIMKLNRVNQVMPILSAIEVYTEEKPDVLICFGDSITQMSHWTTPLRDKFRYTCKNIAVINKGIGGNKLLSEPDNKNMTMYGIAGIKRFQRDVLDVAGGTAVLIAVGVNDLNAVKSEREANGIADELMKTFLNLAAQSRNAGLKVYVATITPSCGCVGYQQLSEGERRKLNGMILTSTEFDGVADFDKAVRNPDNPSVMKEYCDSGDHVHPSVIGGRRMAEVAYALFENS